jgi:acylphosphatase
MNNWDKGNLDFILNSTDEDMEDFLSWASDEDLRYALELIQIAKNELAVQEIEMLETKAHEDFSQAQAVLKRFRL